MKRSDIEKYKEGEWVPYRTAITLFDSLASANKRIKLLETWQKNHVGQIKEAKKPLKLNIRREGNRIIVEPNDTRSN